MTNTGRVFGMRPCTAISSSGFRDPRRESGSDDCSFVSSESTREPGPEEFDTSSGPVCFGAWRVVAGFSSVVILKPKVCNQFFASQVSKRVLELHKLDEQIVFRVKLLCAHGALKVKGEPLLNSAHL